ncbi:hypothetical protein SNE40_016933 [Patella caerulea]|uniref:Uncharacterized protein n=1 Tax=Patella caerulea TaxID=87958 RepID=A0AAN8J9G2_PATCE
MIKIHIQHLEHTCQLINKDMLEAKSKLISLCDPGQLKEEEQAITAVIQRETSTGKARLQPRFDRLNFESKKDDPFQGKHFLGKGHMFNQPRKPTVRASRFNQNNM